MRPYPDRVYRGINNAAASAGFEPFGNRDSWTIVFRSSTAVLTIAWDRGFFSAQCEPRSTPSTVAIDDDFFRQLVDGDPPDPHGGRREWSDPNAFVSFLERRLGEFARLATTDDPELRARLVELAKARADLAQAWWDSHKARRDTSQAPARAASPPSRLLAYAGPYFAIAVGIAVIVSLMLLAERYPHRGFEGALGVAWVFVPIAVTLFLLAARDWRATLRDLKHDTRQD
jgi:hypothetical protein